MQRARYAQLTSDDIVLDGEAMAHCKELGDALGLSTIHVNRSLQELRKKGLITLKGSVLTVEDWPGRLKEAGEFDPTYLHLDGAVERVACRTLVVIA